MKPKLRRMFSAILAVLLLSACVLPAAAEEMEDPMVRASRSPQHEPEEMYFYNEDGNLAWKVQPVWDWYTQYAYYPDGTLKSVTVYKEGEVAEVEQYDSHGNLTQVQEADYRTGKLEVTAAYTNRYDSKGRLTETEGVDQEGQGEISRYTYHADGGWEVDFTDYYVDSTSGEKVLHCHWVTRYDAEGRMIRKDQDLNCMAELGCRETFRYDQQGNLVEHIFEQDFEDDYWEKRETTCQHTYNWKKQLTRTEQNIRDSYPEGDTESAYTITYTYDADGRLTRKVRTSKEHHYEEETLWEYDDQGNLIHYCGEDPDGDSTGLTLLDETYTWLPLSQARIPEDADLAGVREAMSQRQAYEEGLVLTDNEHITVTTGALTQGANGDISITLEMENHEKQDVFVTGRNIQLNGYNIFTSLSSSIPAKDTVTVTMRVDPTPLALLGLRHLQAITMELDVDTYPNSQDLGEYNIKIPTGMPIGEEPLTFDKTVYEDSAFTLSVIGSSLNEGDGLLSVSLLLDNNTASILFLERKDNCKIQGQEYGNPFFVETTFHGTSAVASKIYGFDPAEVTAGTFTVELSVQILNKNLHTLADGTITLTMDKTGKILSCKSDIVQSEKYDQYINERSYF